MKNETKILSAERIEGKAGGKSNLFGKNEGRNRRVNAVGNAVKEPLEPFLKTYPKGKTVKVGDDNTIEQPVKQTKSRNGGKPVSAFVRFG